MTTILSILATRAGGIGAMVLVCLLTVTAGGLGLSLWLTRSDLADERLRANTLESAVKLQNDEVMDWQAKAAAAKSSADARALAKLKPRTKPNLQTVEELNAWLASP